jgi:tRNA (mo5U34)-methyltransferase
MPAAVFQDLYRLWCERGKSDEYMGTLVNAWLARGGRAVGIHVGQKYVDVGTVHGYHEAIKLLGASFYERV